MDKNKENKGSLISIIGGLFTIIGMTLLAMKSSAVLYLSCTIIGVILAAYGVFVMFKAVKLKKTLKDWFKKEFGGEVSDYYGDRLDFYKKIMNPKVFPMILEGMYKEYNKDIRK